MAIKEKFKSIQFRLFLALSISIMLVIFVIILVNNVISASFYTLQKIRTVEQLREEINTYYKDTIQYDINSNLREIEIKNNIQILIKNEKGTIIYAGNKDIASSMDKLEKITTNKRTITKTDKYELINVDETSKNKYILFKSTLDNEYSIYIKIPTTPIKEAVQISNRTLLIIALLMIIISLIVSSLISKRFTKPIVQLNKITKKMANLDFSEKYRISDAEDEINTLGKNINQMSDKLESTIQQLRINNSQLEKDIEKKSKIDEMRKQFISDVSHELKTPIALIQGYAEGLYDNVVSDEESRKFYSEVIIDEAKKMDKLVKELLELMKLEYEERKFNDQFFNLNELINEELRRETVILKEKEISVEFNNSKDVLVYADQDYIEQIINNYITNAIKHCEKINNEKKIVITTQKTKGRKIRLSIYNTGKKIPEENINKIWQRFYKVDSSRNREDGGTGIGLALVKAIMNKYGNKFGAKNVENGVIFYCDINIKH